MKNNKNVPKKAPQKTESAEVPESTQKRSGISFRKVSRTVALVIAILIFGNIAFFSTVVVLANTRHIAASRAEYESLRELASDLEADSGRYDESHSGTFDEEMRQINPDYVGWIRIGGTNIDYPVVRGGDNDRYINTSFYGEENIAGAIFMDYRNTGDLLEPLFGEALPHIIIYGHNLQQGGMFSDLRRFLNSDFFNENRTITLFVNDRVIEFEIFSARLTDINDPAYFLDFYAPHSFPRFADRVEAPLRATQIVTLSTCVNGGSSNARLVVQGYRTLG